MSFHRIKKCLISTLSGIILSLTASVTLASETFDLPSCYSSSEVLTEAVNHYPAKNHLVIKINTLLNESIIACESGQFKLGYDQLIKANQLFEQLKSGS